MKRSYVPLAIIIGGLLIAGAVYLSLRNTTPATEIARAALVRPVSVSDHILGNPAAPVVIIEYADFDCEFCGDLNETLKQIVANEGTHGEVAWVFREFPLIEIHPHAFTHARAAECAARTVGTGAFFAFADQLFDHQPADPATYGALAAAAGITDSAFAACVASASSTIDASITADRQNALAMGSTGAPFAVILANGVPTAVMDGAYSYDAAKQLVDQALQTIK